MTAECSYWEEKKQGFIRILYALGLKLSLIYHTETECFRFYTSEAVQKSFINSCPSKAYTCKRHPRRRRPTWDLHSDGSSRSWEFQNSFTSTLPWLCLNFTCWRFSKFSISSTWICQQRSRCRCQYRQGLHIILYLPMVPMRLYECLRIPECLERSDIQKELSFSKYMIFSLFVSMSWLTLKYHGSGRPFYSTGHWEAKPVDGSRLARSHTNTNQRPTVSLAIGIEAESFIRAFEVKLRRLASYQAHIPRYASPVSPLAEPRLLMAFSLARKAR